MVLVCDRLKQPVFCGVCLVGCLASVLIPLSVPTWYLPDWLMAFAFDGSSRVLGFPPSFSNPSSSPLPASTFVDRYMLACTCDNAGES